MSRGLLLGLSVFLGLLVGVGSLFLISSGQIDPGPLDDPKATLTLWEAPEIQTRTPTVTPTVGWWVDIPTAYPLLELLTWTPTVTPTVTRTPTTTSTSTPEGE